MYRHGQEEFVVFALQYLHQDFHFGYWVKSMLNFKRCIIILLYMQVCLVDLVEPTPYEKG